MRFSVLEDKLAPRPATQIPIMHGTTPSSAKEILRTGFSLRHYGRTSKMLKFLKHYEREPRAVYALVSGPEMGSQPPEHPWRHDQQGAWVFGSARLERPLVMPIHDEDDRHWTDVLMKRYDGKTKDELTKALTRDGYDGIILTIQGGPVSVAVFNPQAIRVDKESTEAALREVVEEAPKIDAIELAKHLVLPARAKAARDKAVLIDVGKFDAAWKATDPKFYISAGGGGASIHGRYERFSDWLSELADDELKRVEAPECYVRDNGEATFVNGRHRFAWLRDHGAKAIVLSLSPKAAKNAERFGYVAGHTQTESNQNRVSSESGSDQKGKRGVVSFDFDGVLHTDVYGVHPIDPWDPDPEPNWPLLSTLRREAKSNDIIIVTARDDTDDYLDPIRAFVKKHKLPVKQIVATSMEPKGPVLKLYGALRHYDDNPSVRDGIEGTEFILVRNPIRSPY